MLVVKCSEYLGGTDDLIWLIDDDCNDNDDDDDVYYCPENCKHLSSWPLSSVTPKLVNGKVLSRKIPVIKACLELWPAAVRHHYLTEFLNLLLFEVTHKFTLIAELTPEPEKPRPRINWTELWQKREEFEKERFASESWSFFGDCFFKNYFAVESLSEVLLFKKVMFA